MRGRLLVVTAALAAAPCAWLACSDAVRSHVYSGRLYDPTRNCLEDIQSIDVVAGPEPETPCAPVCVVGLPDDSGVSLVYVSTECAPYPIYPYESDAGSDPECAQALLANTYNASCEDDGAIINLPPDASAEASADAGVDANVDAGNDAAVDTGPDATADAGADASIDSASE